MELLWQGFLDALRLLVHGDADLFQIMWRSLVISLLATALSGAAGVPMGVLLATTRFPARDWVNTVVNTGMGLPPVVGSHRLSGIPGMSGAAGPFAGIAAGKDGTLYVSGDADGTVLALQPR